MKYRKLKAAADGAYHLPQAADPYIDIIELTRLPTGDRRQDRPQLFAKEGATASAIGSAEKEKVRNPFSWRSRIERLLIDFGVSGNALAFGSAFEPDRSQPALTGSEPALANRSTSLLRLWAAVTGAYYGFRRELAIRRAVHDLRRLNAAALRDIGIFDPSEIEFFVRNGREP